MRPIEAEAYRVEPAPSRPPKFRVIRRRDGKIVFTASTREAAEAWLKAVVKGQGHHEGILECGAL